MTAVRKNNGALVRRVFALCLSAMCCLLLVSCWARKYTRIDLLGAEIVGDRLVLFVDVLSGATKWAVPDSPNRNGVTIAEHALFRVEYHLGGSRSISSQFLFKENDYDGYYEIKPIQNGGTLIVKHFSDGNTELFSFSKDSSLSKRIVVNAAPRPFPEMHNCSVLIKSNTLIIYNDIQQRILQLPTLNEVTNSAFLRALQSVASGIPQREYKFAISDDMNYCTIYSDNGADQIILFSQYNLEKRFFKTGLDLGAHLLEVHCGQGEFMWLCQNEMTVIGNSGHSISYKSSLNGSPIWDPVLGRVLFIPLGFDCNEPGSFQKRWNCWSYTNDQVYSFTLDYFDFLNKLKVNK